MTDTKTAITDALVTHWRETRPPEETAIVTRFVVVAEVIDTDGDMALRIAQSDMPSWTTAGMLRGAAMANDATLAGGWEPDDE